MSDRFVLSGFIREFVIRIKRKPVTILLVSAKIIQDIIHVSAVPKNRHCGYIFEKVSPRQSKRDSSGGFSFASAIIFAQSFSGFSKKV